MSSHKHMFDVDDCQEHGFAAAVILENMRFWTLKKAANSDPVDDGYWVYNSVKAWKTLFPYLTPNKIRSALKLLETKGLLRSGNYNKVKYDQTKWYALANCELCKLHLSETTNGVAGNHKPIPDSKPILNKNMCDTDEKFLEFWSSFPKRIKGSIPRAKTWSIMAVATETLAISSRAINLAV